ncbi:Myb-like DNA-binding domain containing protein [Trichomonas vaginalis G3]|uniref:Myb-like DNA-binding domain containing protein n=1 Tax=Trichomonas vaginalis (strain ATCC PRA-98 / G3) TaxID=412133 RepID=A2EZ40_TRIV3|nr:RNA polymerase II transcription regulator recruiting protein [Trichomonas vaginalis G3]EAY02089.1 Myb-like DNA-binding domain containing protein [Trichomonas vaginalis G3]KAI5512759.1 RNA polymerase II transcription regulator recruiting protein [Trichomonas vaginalis G3]|eukprot:XP_001330844.1 Myb-like DNA-binding domain containing protein [Trichomonas vaginalis G3]
MSEEKRKFKSVKFSHEEDKLLTYLITECKHTNWVTIASLMPGRNVQQCRDRWRHVLCKHAASKEWTEEENALLMQKYHDFGKKWNVIQTSFPNHTVVQVKNHCKQLLAEKDKPKAQIKEIPKVEILTKAELPIQISQMPTDKMFDELITDALKTKGPLDLDSYWDVNEFNDTPFGFEEAN